jgi:hypothetical protein
MTLDDGSILAAWTMAVPQTFIQTARGDAAGQLWSTPLDVQAPVLNIANYQPVLAQAGDGLVALVWVCAVSGTYSAQYSFSNTRGSSWLSQGGNLSSWPDDVAGVSVVPFVNKGFAFGWNQRTGTAPDQAIFRPYGWVAQPSPAPSAPDSAATLANTGTSGATATLGVVAAILIALGWIIRARFRQRSA